MIPEKIQDNKRLGHRLTARHFSTIARGEAKLSMGTLDAGAITGWIVFRQASDYCM
jgi:hypothetical protein